MGQELQTWFSVEEMAKFLGVSTIWIYRMTKLEKMPYHRVGKLLKFNRDEINKWVLGNKSNFKTSGEKKS